MDKGLKNLLIIANCLSKKGKKGSEMKKFFVLVIALAMIVTSLTGCGVTRKNLYDSSNKEILQGFVFYPDETQSLSERDYIDDLSKSATNFEVVEDDLIRELKAGVIKYFNEEYEIDVTEKVNNIETQLFTVEDNLLFGYHVPGENVVYVNRELYEHDDKLIPFTWCHEVIHLLGLNYTDKDYWAIYEVLTEAMNIRMAKWLDYPVNEWSSYMDVVDIGEQMIIANPEIIKRSIIDDEFLPEEHIEDVLKDAVYPIVNPLEHFSIAEHFNYLLESIIVENLPYQEVPNMVKFMTQEITTAYCRTFNLDDEQINASKKLWLVKEFDKVTITEAGGNVHRIMG